MPGPLDNPRHEKFCREYVKGSSATRAYKTVYETDRELVGAGQMAHNLLKNVEVYERIEELRELSSDGFIMRMVDRREFFNRVKLVNLLKEVDPERDGDLVQEVEYYPAELGGGIKKIKLPGKRECIMDDAKLAGELKEQQEVTHLGDPNQPITVTLPAIVCTPRRRKPSQKAERDSGNEG
jgi:hypothetical protein